MARLVLGIVVVFGLTLLVACDISTESTAIPTAADPTLEASRIAAQATYDAGTQTVLEIARYQAAATYQAAQNLSDQIQASQTAAAAATSGAATALAAGQTQIAAGTATQRSWEIVLWTATADAAAATSTASAGQAVATSTAAAQQTSQALQVASTQSALDRQATQEAVDLAAQATVQSANAALAEQAVQRNQMINDTVAIGQVLAWPVGIILGVMVLLFIWQTWLRNRLIRRDERGAAPVILVDGKVVQADRMVFPLLDPAQPGQIPLPAQLQATSQAQQVELVRALPPELASRAGRQVVRQLGQAQSELANPALPTEIEVVEGDSVIDGWVREVEVKLLTTGGER